MFKNIKLKVISIGALLLSSGVAQAQCAMCRAALGGESNNAQAQAVNDGIVYLMAIPYVLVGIIGYAVYRLYRKKKVS
ncbi:hypothetical protein [Flavobacterium frigidarium]|jgi:hypothetical protein|uniref:hypothetical protein n=1 Tax=Flavobacterium frigidarium TaxID=99286 RepID=UPI0003F6C280|nr:hypothetical protein [Flavobacterium frigidarium]